MRDVTDAERNGRFIRTPHCLPNHASLITNQGMKAVTLKAHWDGKHVFLDEPFEIPSDAKLFVTVIPAETVEEEHQAWLAASQASFARAYGDNEPDYSNALLREAPPDK